MARFNVVTIVNVVVWILATIAIIAVEGDYKPYEIVVLSSGSLGGPLSSVTLLEDSNIKRDSILLVSVVEGMPATKNMDGLSVFSIDRDECVDLAIVFETIRRGDGIRVYRPYSDMTKFEPGVWSFHNGDDSISYGDIISDMLKDAPVGASASIIVTTCPILSPAEDGDICKPNKPSDFKVSHVQSAIFGTLLLYTIALITV